MSAKGSQICVNLASRSQFVEVSCAFGGEQEGRLTDREPKNRIVWPTDRPFSDVVAEAGGVKTAPRFVRTPGESKAALVSWKDRYKYPRRVRSGQWSDSHRSGGGDEANRDPPSGSVASELTQSTPDLWPLASRVTTASRQLSRRRFANGCVESGDCAAVRQGGPSCDSRCPARQASRLTFDRRTGQACVEGEPTRSLPLRRETATTASSARRNSPKGTTG